MSGPVYPYRDRRFDSWWWEASSKPGGSPTPYPVLREGIVRFLQDCPPEVDVLRLMRHAEQRIAKDIGRKP